MSVDMSSTPATRGVDSARARVASAIKHAANATGVSFEELLATANMQWVFNPSARAPTSSAHGLYQFIEQTWLRTVKQAGPGLGYGAYADAIAKTSSGDYAVADPAMRAAIMKLRDDPAVASAMAGMLTQSNSFQLTGLIGRRPTNGELYMAHFLGVSGAGKLINTAEDSPQVSAARLFPNAAAANRSIFYDRQGRARSVLDVYSVLSARYAGAANSPATQKAVAMFGGAGAAPAVNNALYLSTFPDVRAAAPIAVASAAGSHSPPSSPLFRSLFQVNAGGQPVSSTVHQLWGSSASPASDANSASTGKPGAAPSLDLFSDRNGAFRS
ncbi:MAG: lytic transglycosylase domain-containing protein [Bradyrhizobium sp.]